MRYGASSRHMGEPRPAAGVEPGLLAAGLAIILDAAGLAESLNARGGDVRRGLAQAGRNADASEAGTLRTARLH